MLTSQSLHPSKSFIHGWSSESTKSTLLPNFFSVVISSWKEIAQGSNSSCNVPGMPTSDGYENANVVALSLNTEKSCRRKRELLGHEPSYYTHIHIHTYTCNFSWHSFSLNWDCTAHRIINYLSYFNWDETISFKTRRMLTKNRKRRQT